MYYKGCIEDYDRYLSQRANDFFNEDDQEELEDICDREEQMQFDENHEQWDEWNDRRAEMYNFNV